MKVDPLGVGRMPVIIETISHLQNMFGARAESTRFRIDIDGKPFVGAVMLRENADGSLSLLLAPQKEDRDKYDGKFDWDAWFKAHPPNIAAGPASAGPSPVVLSRPGDASRRRHAAALEGGDAA